MSQVRIWIVASTLLLVTVALPSATRAQARESDPVPRRGQFEPDSLLPKSYFVPDIPNDVAEKAEVRKRWFTLKPGVALLVDYTAFSQDAKSVAQVGTQDDQWDDRTLRAMFRGTIGQSYKAKYDLSVEYKGFDTEPDETWSLIDLSFTFPLRGAATQLVVGKTKESLVYEMVGDAVNLPHLERVLSPFFVSRNVGLKVSNVWGAEHRMTGALGVFNDWWVTGMSLSESGTDVTGRFTALLTDDPERNRFLHVAMTSRYFGADKGALRYQGRPESNVTDNYVDTGNFPSDHAWHLGWEALWNEGPWSVLAEYAVASVNSPENGNPTFSGYYLTGSWVMTGETRKYDRTVGYARRVMPDGHWGAPELVARFSHLDLDDNSIEGGSLDKTMLGINWWATRRWKAGLVWGHTWLDRFGVKGVTDAVQTRLQWVY